MKIIHIGDLHLDSKMKTNLDSSKAKKRRNELVLSFENVVTFAKKEEVRLIIIAGDMFDHQKVTQTTVQTVSDIISGAGEIEFLLLLGNHDKNNPFSLLPTSPANLKIFTDSWNYYDFDKITVAGVSLNDSNRNVVYSSLALSSERYNIAVMHGDIESDINLPSLKGKNIDYLALGHIHKHSAGELDARGKYAYCGCLESRGFDESGKKGFILLDTDSREFQFITGLTIRNMYELEVDISGLLSYTDIKAAVSCTLSENGVRECDMVKIILKGSYTVDTNKDIEQLLSYLQNTFFFARLEDLSSMEINAEDYKNDISLKGEFVRKTLGSELSEEEKQAVIMYGIRALRGEEL